MSEASERHAVQFHLRDLFLATALMALGIGGFVAVARVDSWTNVPLFFMLWYGSGGLVGAGLFAPFKKFAVGAITGFLVTATVTTIIPLLR